MGSMLPYIAAPWILWVCHGKLFHVPQLLLPGAESHVRIRWPARHEATTNQ